MIKVIIILLMFSNTCFSRNEDFAYYGYYELAKCDVDGNIYYPDYNYASSSPTPKNYCSRDVICSKGKYKDGQVIKDSDLEIFSRFFVKGEEINAKKLNIICDNYHKKNSLK